MGLTCMGRGVPGEPSTRPVGQGSSRAAPSSDWMNPRSHPKTEGDRRAGVVCQQLKTTLKCVREVGMFSLLSLLLDSGIVE